LIRNPFLQALATGAFLLSLSGCAEAPINVTDNNVEKPLEQITGVTSDVVEKAAKKAQMNLWDVYALAVKHTEDLASKYENILQADAQSQQAVGSVLPQIFLNDKANWQSNNYVFGSENALFQPLGNTLYLSGTETLLTGLNQVAAIQGAQAQIDQNHHLYKQEARTLLLNVARSFYGILQLQDTLQSKQEIEGLTLEILKQEQQWKNIGRSRDSDVLTTQAQLAQLKGDEEAAQGQLNIARDSLVVLTGLQTEQPLVSEEQPVTATMSFEQAEALVDSRSDVIAAKAGVDLAEASVLQAHGEHLPSLAVQGQYYLQQDGGSPTADWNVQLVASLPLFEGGAIVAQEHAADSKKRQADLQYDLTRRTALQDIRGAYRALANSLNQVDAYGKALDAAQKDYTAVERDRKLALNTNLDVLNSLTQLETAKSNYDQAKYQVLINSIWLGEATDDLPKIPDEKNN
jgi:outer membrane protein